jgi:hypothetical protein
VFSVVPVHVLYFGQSPFRQFSIRKCLGAAILRVHTQTTYTNHTTPSRWFMRGIINNLSHISIVQVFSCDCLYSHRDRYRCSLHQFYVTLLLVTGAVVISHSTVSPNHRIMLVFLLDWNSQAPFAYAIHVKPCCSTPSTPPLRHGLLIYESDAGNVIVSSMQTCERHERGPETWVIMPVKEYKD